MQKGWTLALAAGGLSWRWVQEFASVALWMMMRRLACHAARCVESVGPYQQQDLMQTLNAKLESVDTARSMLVQSCATCGNEYIVRSGLPMDVGMNYLCACPLL
jgi:predicted RNA-binding Zn-ribbon protein involved in translation (DUF1610 family)